MTKRDAKRWVCDRVSRALSAGLVDDEAIENLSPADQMRVDKAVENLIEEMKIRARNAAPTQEDSVEDH